MVLTDTSSFDGEGGGFASLGFGMRLLVVAWAALIASFPLSDNSFFTHLATGRLILDEGSVPSSDPYSFTARGADWTVQSWLASVLYAAAERSGGAVGLRLLVLAVLVAAGLLLWRLTLPASSLVLRLVIVSVAMFVATGLWSERPYMIGVIGLAVVWLALEGSVTSWILVPLLWVWANTHGSYPLAFVLIAAVMVGEAIDGRRDRQQPGNSTTTLARLRTELAVVKAVAAGSLLAMIGPLGPEVILFPLKAVTQSDLLAEVVEWQAPNFRSNSERAFLVLLLASVAALTHLRSWRLTLPALVFTGAALVAQRNVVMATVVLVPVIAAAAPRFGALTARSKPSLGAAFSAICAVSAAGAVALALTNPVTSFGRYPARAVAWIEANERRPAEIRIATQDRTGNFLELVADPDWEVFIDDRADMFPPDVFSDYLVLLRGSPRWSQVLDGHEIDVVVWERAKPLGSLLAADSQWQTVFADRSWTVSCRRGQQVCDQFRR